MGFEPGFGHGPVVKGVPFSAQTTAETVAVLQDGTHIDRKTSGAFARDSQGRTRSEETVPPVGQRAALTPWPRNAVRAQAQRM